MRASGQVRGCWADLFSARRTIRVAARVFGGMNFVCAPACEEERRDDVVVGIYRLDVTVRTLHEGRATKLIFVTVAVYAAKTTSVLYGLEHPVVFQKLGGA